jgi:2-hydroxychromene-2-carboxylate isomerase
VTEAAACVFEAPLSVCVDFGNPHAFLAIAPTRALERRAGVAIDWLPFAAPPLYRPPPPRPDDDRGARHRRIRALYVERDLARYATARGVELGDVYRGAASPLARLGLLWVRRTTPQNAGEYVERLFELRWREHRDIDAPEVVAALVAEFAPAGCADYCGDECVEALDALEGSLVAAGITNVPTYVLSGGEIFVGRQHLPLIETRLSKRAE